MWYCLNCKDTVPVIYTQIVTVREYNNDYDIMDWGEYVKLPQCNIFGSTKVKEYFTEEELPHV